MPTLIYSIGSSDKARGALTLLTGWRRLPDELKVEILRRTLPHGLRFDASIFNPDYPLAEGKCPNAACKEADLYRKIVLPLLSIPEIHHFVAQVFYEQNTIKVKHRSFYRSEGKFFLERTVLPPKHVQPFIRHLEVKLQHVDHKTNLFLQRLAAPAFTLRFAGLHHLKLTFKSNLVTSASVSQSIIQYSHAYINPIDFPTKVLEVEYYHNPPVGLNASGMMRSNALGVDPFEVPLLSKLSIQKKGVGTKAEPSEEWERYFDDRHMYGGRNREYVSAWPASIQASLPASPFVSRSKVTSKVVGAL